MQGRRDVEALCEYRLKACGCADRLGNMHKVLKVSLISIKLCFIMDINLGQEFMREKQQWD